MKKRETCAVTALVEKLSSGDLSPFLRGGLFGIPSIHCGSTLSYADVCITKCVNNLMEIMKAVKATVRKKTTINVDVAYLMEC